MSTDQQKSGNKKRLNLRLLDTYAVKHMENKPPLHICLKKSVTKCSDFQQYVVALTNLCLT